MAGPPAVFAIFGGKIPRTPISDSEFEQFYQRTLPSWIPKILILVGTDLQNRTPPQTSHPLLDPLAEWAFIDRQDRDVWEQETACRSIDALVAFASDPDPDRDFAQAAQRFENNTLCTYNSFLAACQTGIGRVVWASSETVLGYPFENCAPRAVPVDESHPPQPQNSYAISKLLCEQAAQHLHALYGTTFIGLRLSNVIYERDHRDMYSRFPSYWDDAQIRRFDLWSYVDARDAAASVCCAQTADVMGAEVFIVAADDTVMRRSSRSLMAEVFPEVPVAPDLGEYQSLISNARARRILNWAPRYSWREILGE